MPMNIGRTLAWVMIVLAVLADGGRLLAVAIAVEKGLNAAEA